jgi:hypothetical protein
MLIEPATVNGRSVKGVGMGPVDLKRALAGAKYAEVMDTEGKVVRRLPLFEPEQLALILEEESMPAWRLQFEYVDWRISQGLEPSRNALNRWEQAMDEIGLTVNPGGANPHHQ